MSFLRIKTNAGKTSWLREVAVPAGRSSPLTTRVWWHQLQTLAAEGCFSSSWGPHPEPLSPTQAQPDRGPQASEDGSDDFPETGSHPRAWDRVAPSSPPGVGSVLSWGRRAESQSLVRMAAVPSQGVRPQLCLAMHKASSHAELHPRPRLRQDVHFNPRFSAGGITPEASWANPRRCWNPLPDPLRRDLPHGYRLAETFVISGQCPIG